MHLSIDVDRGATDGNNTVEVVVFAADGLLIAVTMDESD